MESIAIPHVQTVGEAAFYYCSNLTTIVIPSTVQSIGSVAFGNCTSLFSITIPSSVKYLDDSAFDGCSNLKNITILAATPPVIYISGAHTSTGEEEWCARGTLHVLPGCKSAYQSIPYWRYCTIIEDAVPQCDIPDIKIKDGKFSATCLTEGVTYETNSTVNLNGEWSESDGELSISIKVSVVAKKEGYADSAPATKNIVLEDLIGVKGDVNGDNKLTLKDVNSLINILLKK